MIDYKLQKNVATEVWFFYWSKGKEQGVFILPLYYKRILQRLGFVGLFWFGFFLVPLVNSSPSGDTPLTSTSNFWSFLAIHLELLQGLSWQQGLQQARAIAGLCALNNISVIQDRLSSTVNMWRLWLFPSAACCIGSVPSRSARQGEGNRTQQLGLAEASRTCLGSWVWKTQPRLSGSAGTARHVPKNKYIVCDSTFWHESDVSRACVGVVALL